MVKVSDKKATWKWRADNSAYLTAKGESAISPRARVYPCAAAPKSSAFHWTVAINGTALAVCRDTTTALRLGREFAEGGAA